MPHSSASTSAFSRGMFASRIGASTSQVGREHAERHLEPHLVVALAGAAVRHDVGADLARDLHDLLHDQRPREPDTIGYLPS